MALLIWFLGLLDILLTDYGLKAGFIKERNPLLAHLFQANPIVAILFSLALSGILLCILHHLKQRTKLAYHSLIGLLFVKSAVLLLHATWLIQTYYALK